MKLFFRYLSDTLSSVMNGQTEEETRRLCQLSLQNYQSAQEFVITKLKTKSSQLRLIQRWGKFSKIIAALVQDASCDIITVHVQPKPS